MFLVLIRLTCLVSGWLLVVAGGRAETLFTFGAYGFDQDKTPDRAYLLGNSTNLGGAQFSTNLPNSSNTPHNFPSTNAPGFDGLLTLGRLTGVIVTNQSSRTLQLPRGNVGTTNRHGLAVYWSGGRGLVNGPGEEFVIYESGNSNNLVENPMLRLKLGNGSYTSWYYFFPTNPFTYYPGEEADFEGSFATACDLSSFGVSNGAAIYEIQIANLVANDRTDVLTNIALLATGRVLPGNLTGAGDSTHAKPDRGPLAASSASGRNYDVSSLDPDLMYVAVLPGTVMAPVPLRFKDESLQALADGSFQFSVTGEAGRAVQILASSNLVNWSSVLTNTNAAGEITFTDSTATNDAQRFYRALMP